MLKVACLKSQQHRLIRQRSGQWASWPPTGQYQVAIAAPARNPVGSTGGTFAALTIADTFVSTDSDGGSALHPITQCPCARQVPVFITDLVTATSRRTAGVTEEHYNRAMSTTSGEEYGIIAQRYRQREVTVRPSAVNSKFLSAAAA